MNTLALRPACAPIFLPLFDHLVGLARSSYAHFEAVTVSGRDYLARRAGRALADARRVAAYQVCEVCGAPLRRGVDQCSALLDSGQHGAAPAPETASHDTAWQMSGCDLYPACAALKG